MIWVNDKVNDFFIPKKTKKKKKKQKVVDETQRVMCDVRYMMYVPSTASKYVRQSQIHHHRPE